MKTALVLGAGGFIGSHMVKRLRADGYWVRGVDLKYPEFSETEANEFVCMDLTDREVMRRVIRYGGERGNFYRSIIDKFLEPFDEIYQFAADMGGAGFIFTGDNDADIMRNSACINLNLLEEQRKWNEDKGTNHTKIFYSSSACMYPEHNQLDPDNPDCRESSAYPANPDSEYGWEKLFSERLYLSYHRNYNIPICIARYHNIYGPESTWEGGREKAPAAICRKVANACDEDSIEVWGDGLNRPDHSSTLTNVSKPPEDSWNRTLHRTHQHRIRGDGYDKSVSRYCCRDCWKEDNQRSCGWPSWCSWS